MGLEIKSMYTSSIITEYAHKNGVHFVVLNRPEKHNAMSEEMIVTLADVANRLANDSEVRVVVLKGEGTSFCAGADLAWMQKQFSATDTERRDQAFALATMLRRWYELPKPLIGQIHGSVFGGGVGLTSVCDVAIAEESTKFAFSETRLGLIPATISPYVIAKIGSEKAIPLFMSGRKFTVDAAINIGLVDQSTTKNNLETVILKEAKTYLQSAPDSVAAAKLLARQGQLIINDSQLEWTVEQLVNCWSNPAASEGVRAFFEKRKPKWM